MAGSRSRGSSSGRSETWPGADTEAEGLAGKCLLTVSGFFLGCDFAGAGFVTFPLGNVVCVVAAFFVDSACLPCLAWGGRSASRVSTTGDPATSCGTGGDSLFVFLLVACDLGFSLALPNPPFARSIAASLVVSWAMGATASLPASAVWDEAFFNVSMPPLSPRWDERHMDAALVNAVGAPSGIGAALLPLRNGLLLVAFGRRSQMDGNSGEDEITMTELSCAILAGDEASKPPVAILGLSSSANEARDARSARPRLARRMLGDDRVAAKRRGEETVSFGWAIVRARPGDWCAASSQAVRPGAWLTGRMARRQTAKTRNVWHCERAGAGRVQSAASRTFRDVS